MPKPLGLLRPMLLVAPLIGWFALPVVLVFANGMLQDRWMLQDTKREYAYMGAVAVAWFVPIALRLCWGSWAHIPWRELAGLVAWAILTGVVSGHLVLNLRNHCSTAVGEPVEFKIVRHERVSVRLRVLGDGYDGITFRCANGKWSDHYREPEGTAPGFLYRGRLGLLWGEFRNQ